MWVTDAGIFRVADMARAQGAAGAYQTIDPVLADPALMNRVQEWSAKIASAGLNPVTPTRWLAPVPRPSKIVCVGLNYRPHVAESKQQLPTHPVLFNKYQTSVRGSGDTVRPPKDAANLDYEAELVIVMGRTARNVPEAAALDYVLGYCNGNDISARDLQFRSGQWLLGKACDGFGPMGPYVVTADEVPNPNNLEIRGFRNDEVVQHSNTREMIFDCRELISYISRYITLEPGDVIFTGTPEGVIQGMPESEQRWLQPGETLAVEIEGLGRLTNTIGTPEE
ncbi:MAG: fumarylacetoacetate hydrolase family protein [Firmicutes bacterium]|nr:fumarylacetoacetate hydrolase family protein [Bacillota bacterium]